MATDGGKFAILCASKLGPAKIGCKAVVGRRRGRSLPCGEYHGTMVCGVGWRQLFSQKGTGRQHYRRKLEFSNGGMILRRCACFKSASSFSHNFTVPVDMEKKRIIKHHYSLCIRFSTPDLDSNGYLGHQLTRPQSRPSSQTSLLPNTSRTNHLLLALRARF